MRNKMQSNITKLYLTNIKKEMKKKIDERLKKRGKLFRSLPISDWHQIIAFEKIIRNYLKISELLKEVK
jgi:hypothetical protein